MLYQIMYVNLFENRMAHLDTIVGILLLPMHILVHISEAYEYILTLLHTYHIFSLVLLFEILIVLLFLILIGQVLMLFLINPQQFDIVKYLYSLRLIQISYSVMYSLMSSVKMLCFGFHPSDSSTKELAQVYVASPSTSLNGYGPFP